MIYVGIFFFLSKTYVVTPHLNCLVGMVQMRGHREVFIPDLTDVIPYYSQIGPLV